MDDKLMDNINDNEARWQIQILYAKVERDAALDERDAIRARMETKFSDLDEINEEVGQTLDKLDQTDASHYREF